MSPGLEKRLTHSPDHAPLDHAHDTQDMRESGDANFRAKLLVLAGERAQLSGDERTASRLFARSTHCCPCIAEVRSGALAPWTQQSILARFACRRRELQQHGGSMNS